ncbi:hypothetical protein E2C01_036144 [Portunus trituberculatus]|uniref:Uncharacterized protein n=1 Tax=Portunus trituberculatus TaxID=210409 RepID=A0A5B7F7X3_PORTR|nr:hypothetical protein [Portunus trituberculatus]
MQELDQEVKEMFRLGMGRFSEGGKRPMKVRMRSQVAVEEIMIRKGKLANDTEFQDIWIRDMNWKRGKRRKCEEMKLRKKNKKRQKSEKKIFYWRVLDMRQKEWCLQEEEVMEEARN